MYLLSEYTYRRSGGPSRVYATLKRQRGDIIKGGMLAPPTVVCSLVVNLSRSLLAQNLFLYTFITKSSFNTQFH